MPEFSIVIICRNEAGTIERTLRSLEGLTDDIVVFDNGSTDGTQTIVRDFRVQLYEGGWEGFGKTRQKAVTLARHDWILSLDADESPDDELKRSLASWEPRHELVVYDLAFKNFLGKKWLRYGEWGGDHHIRLFNRKNVKFDDAPVHENLLLPPGAEVAKLKGFVLHQTMRDMEEYGRKMLQYAMLNAEKYHRAGKKASWWKIRFSPVFTFLNYYILRLGFLDGVEGYACAKMTAWYTFMKYARLRELVDKSNS